jgi:hypothetical protein
MSAILAASMGGFDWTARLTPIRSVNPTNETGTHGSKGAQGAWLRPIHSFV